MKRKLLLVSLVVAVLIMSLSSFTVSANDLKEYAPGISAPVITDKGAVTNVSFQLDPSEMVFNKLTLIAISVEDSTGKIDAIKASVYDKTQSTENSISAEITINPGCSLKYYLLDSNGGTSVNYPPVSPSNTSADFTYNSVELIWGKSEDDFDDVTEYTIKSNGEVIGSVPGDTNVFRAEGLGYDVEHEFQITAVDGNGLASAPSIVRSIIPYSRDISVWQYDIYSEETDDGSFKYTDEQLKIATTGNCSHWSIVDNDHKYNRTTGKWEDYDIGEYVIKLARYTSNSYLAVVFGDDIKANDSVDLYFDFNGSRLYQTCDVIYMNTDGKVTTSVINVSGDWKQNTIKVNTAFELSDYGLPGEYGFVFQYKSSGDPEYDAFYFKNLQVSTSDMLCAEAIPELDGENGIILSGKKLEKSGDRISGKPVRSGGYAFGYDVYTLDGVKAFYLTKMYDENSSENVSFSSSCLGFKVTTDKFPKTPTQLPAAYVAIRYFDGAEDGLRAPSFKVYTNDSASLLGRTIGEVTLTGDNRWHTAVLPVPSGAYLGKFSSVGADIIIKITNASDSDDCGLLVRSVALMDEAYYNKYYK